MRGRVLSLEKEKKENIHYNRHVYVRLLFVLLPLFVHVVSVIIYSYTNAEVHQVAK